MEGDNFALLIYSVLLGLPALGLVASLIVEIVLLKSTGWVDGKNSIKYPLLVFLINIPVIFFLVVLNFVAYGVLSATFLLMSTVITVIASVVLTVLYAAVLFAARLLVTRLAAGSSGLTWKYVATQALALALIIVISMPILSVVMTQTPE